MVGESRGLLECEDYDALGGEVEAEHSVVDVGGVEGLRGYFLGLVEVVEVGYIVGGEYASADFGGLGAFEGDFDVLGFVE